MKRILPFNRLQFTLNVVLFTFFFCFSSLKTNAQTFSATWPFTSGLASSVTGTDATRVTADAATYTSGTGGVFTGAVTTSTGFLNGTAISGKALATCNSLYNSVGSTTPITPYIEFKLAPNPGYNMTTNSFNFTVEQTTAVSGTSIAAGFSVDGGSSFTGLAAPTGGGTGATLAASPTGTYFGTTAGILTFTVPATSIAATNSFILRIVIWRNNASNSSSANFKIAPPVITGSTTLNVSPVITAPAPGTLSNFNYIVGAGPSASQSFIVSGTNLSANLVVSPATDYEISSDNVSFSSTTPISITPASGSVPSTTLYARLIAGRATGTYNNEAINITSTGAIAQSVICSGFVTANYSYDGSGSLADVNNWGDNSDGSGNHPVNFTTNYQFFTIKNTTAVSTDAAWTVSGTGSKIIVGSATSAAVIVTISSVGNITGTIDLSSASSGSNKLVIANTAFLPANLGVLSASSILEFQVTISSTRSTYENNILVSNGVFTHAPAAGAANVMGNVTVTGGSFVLAGTSASTIFGNVTVTGGTFMTNSSTINGNVNVSSAGIFNLNTGGAARSLTLNGNLSVSGTGGIINSGVPSSSGAVQSFNISLSGINKTITYTASGGNLTKTNFYVIGSYALAGDLDFTSAGTTVFAAGQAFFTRLISILTTGSLSIGANTLKMGNSILDVTAPGTLTDEAASIVETTCAAFNAHAVLEVNEPIAQLPILPSRTWLGTVKYIYSGTGNYGQKIVSGTYNNIIINNTLSIELSGATSISGTLSLISGTLTTGSNNLSLDNSASATFSPSSVLSISGGTTDFNNRPVTLQSTVAGTARIGTITGTLTGATNVTVERYIPAKRAWRALTAPVSTTTSIFANWQENGTGNTINGFDIWSNSGGTGIISGGSGSSLLSYNSSTNNWSGITDTTTSSSLLSGSVNKPFMAFVTGPYGSGNVTSGATATTIRATGALFTGNQTYANTANQYTFIGNPYASPLDPALMLNDTDNAAFGGNIWVWDANATGSNTVGTYNLFNSGTYTNVTSNPVVTSGTQIQSGQAFFVKSAAGGTFTIKEAHKGTTFSNAVFRTAAPELLRVGLYKQENNLWAGRDGAMTVILSDASANQSPNKMANSTENIAFTKNGANFASNHHLPLVASDVLNVKVWNTTAGANYKLKLNTEEFSATNLEATLEDLFTNSRTPLTLDGSAVEYPFTVTTDALSTGDRFRIVFQTAALGTNIPQANGFSIVPNPVTGDSFQVNLGTLATGTYSYSIFNAIGQEVEKGSINNALQNTNYTVKFRESAATGIYIMKIKGSDNSVFTAKIIKK